MVIWVSATSSSELHDHVGREVKRRRLAAGMSIAELAQRADVSAPFVSQLETGRTSMSIPTLAYPLAGDTAKIDASRDLQIAVGVEDLGILERMADPNVQLDIRAEVHTKADLGTLEYRRMLAELANLSPAQPASTEPT